MAVTARLTLNLSASQSLPTSAFTGGGVNYGINGLDQAFASTDVDAVYVQEFALTQNVETLLDLSDMNGGNDALGNPFDTGSIVAVIIQVAAGLVGGNPQHVVVRGLGGASNDLPLQSTASKVALHAWTAPGGCPLAFAPDLRFESLNGAATVAVVILTSEAAGTAPPDRRRFLTLELRHVALNGALATTFLPIPSGHSFTLVRAAALTETATLAVGGTAQTFAVGYSSNGIAETAEWDDSLAVDGTARYVAASPEITGTATAGSHSIFVKSVTTGGNAKHATILLTGYLLPD